MAYLTVSFGSVNWQLFNCRWLTILDCSLRAAAKARRLSNLKRWFEVSACDRLSSELTNKASRSRQPSLKSKSPLWSNSSHSREFHSVLVMSATIKLYELAGAGRVVSAHSLCWRQTINCHLARSPARCFRWEARQTMGLLLVDFEQIVQSPNLCNGAVPTLQHLIDVCAFSQLGDSTMTAITLDLHSIVDLTTSSLPALPSESRYQIRAQSQGELIVMPPTGWRTGNRNTKLTHVWQTGLIRMEPVPSTPPLASPFLMELIALLCRLGEARN